MKKHLVDNLNLLFFLMILWPCHVEANCCHSAWHWTKSTAEKAANEAKKLAHEAVKVAEKAEELAKKKLEDDYDSVVGFLKPPSISNHFKTYSDTKYIGNISLNNTNYANISSYGGFGGSVGIGVDFHLFGHHYDISKNFNLTIGSKNNSYINYGSVILYNNNHASGRIIHIDNTTYGNHTYRGAQVNVGSLIY